MARLLRRTLAGFACFVTFAACGPSSVPEDEVSVVSDQQGVYTCPAPTQYCTYEWDKLNMCCNATYTAPGAYCPRICL